MLLIGESLNVISKKIGRAFKERDPKPIQEEALFKGKGHGLYRYQPGSG